MSDEREEYFLSEMDKAEAMDTEARHIRADEVLCEALRHLGYDHLVDAFERLPKWYA
jgi:hypothetical protein